MKGSWCFICLFFIGCSQTPTERNNGSIKYAKGFSIEEKAGVIYVTVYAQDHRKKYAYILVKDLSQVPKNHNATVVQIPIQSLICTSTTHIPMLEYLDETEVLSGFPHPEYISSKKMRERVDKDMITDVGMNFDLDVEKIVSLRPTAIMTYPVAGEDQMNSIQQIGIPVIMNADYLEDHPLGRAEWIRFFGLFFNKREVADSIFFMIENKYEKLITNIQSEATQPTLMSGNVFGDSWFLPGGNSYMAKLFHDAGFHYLWKGNDQTGSIPQPLELVFSIAKNADYWIGVGDTETKDELKIKDHRYTLFKAFQEGSVYSYYQRNESGTPFLELGYLRPDLILKDLVSIREKKENNLYFFHKLR